MFIKHISTISSTFPPVNRTHRTLNTKNRNNNVEKHSEKQEGERNTLTEDDTRISKMRTVLGFNCFTQVENEE